MLADLKEDISLEGRASPAFQTISSSRLRSLAKRGLDICVALGLLIATMPLMLIVGALILAQGGRRIVFAHERIGRHGRPFRCLKFRTMVHDADTVLRDLLARSPEAQAEWALSRKLRNDPRILGAVGRFLRQTSLDELPQIVNVLRGDMSLVGPRPVVAAELKQYENKLHWYLSIRPGLTGPWQISGRSDTSYATRVKLDVEYAMNPSLRRDFLILLRTPFAVLTGKGAC